MPQDSATQNTLSLQIDIVSDVMCPWCIVGYRQLEKALAMVGVGAFIRWHPFELNPQMGPEGQNMAEHITQKYGITAEQSGQNRANLVEIGTGLGIDFQFSPDSRMVNSFAAHQLLHWAQGQNLQHPLNLRCLTHILPKGATCPIMLCWLISQQALAWTATVRPRFWQLAAMQIRCANFKASGHRKGFRACRR